MLSFIAMTLTWSSYEITTPAVRPSSSKFETPDLRYAPQIHTLTQNNKSPSPINLEASKRQCTEQWMTSQWVYTWIKQENCGQRPKCSFRPLSNCFHKQAACHMFNQSRYSFSQKLCRETVCLMLLPV